MKKYDTFFIKSAGFLIVCLIAISGGIGSTLERGDTFGLTLLCISGIAATILLVIILYAGIRDSKYLYIDTEKKEEDEQKKLKKKKPE